MKGALRVLNIAPDAKRVADASSSHNNGTVPTKVKPVLKSKKEQADV